MKTPVVLIIFDRQNHTQKVFDAIRHAKPETLILIADGPRNEAEKLRTDATRAVVDQIDWPCVVHKKYTDHNRGCRTTLSEGLTWAFNLVDRAIVFEADCLPHPDFFTFCEELLERYKDDERIMHISGNFFQQRNKNFSCPDSYYFSALPHIWGFATWSRAWKYYDSDLKLWPEIKKDQRLRKVLPNKAVYEYWETVWDGYYTKKVNSWDGQWTFACMLNKGLSITPTTNLVSNIGFGPEAMQTKDENSIFANIPALPMSFPLKHPRSITINKIADDFTWKQNFNINTKLRQKILGPIRRTLPKSYGLVRNLFKK